jgi:hypothetical protein
MLEQLGAIPVAHLGAEPVFADLARRQHDMRVRLGLAVGADIPMHIEIGDHPAIDELALDEVARQPDALGLVQLARNRKLDLARQLRVLAQLGCLDRIPQRSRSCQLPPARHPAASPRNERRRPCSRSRDADRAAHRAAATPSDRPRQPARSTRWRG